MFVFQTVAAGISYLGNIDCGVVYTMELFNLFADVFGSSSTDLCQTSYVIVKFA